MATIFNYWIEFLIWLPLASAVVALGWWRGWIGPGSMRHISPRNTGLTILDLVVGLLIMIMGMAAFQWLAIWRGWIVLNGSASPPASQPTLTAGQAALQALTGQLLSQGPVVAYLLVRCGTRDNGLQELGALPRLWWKELLAGVVGTVAVLPLVMASIAMTVLVGYAINGKLPAELGHPTLEAIRNAQGLALWGNLVSALLMAPFLEEFIFRGLIQSSLVDMPGFAGRRWLVIVASASLFMLVHMGGVLWQALPGLLCLGLVLALIYERTGSLWPCILIHMGFNSCNVGQTLLKG